MSIKYWMSLGGILMAGTSYVMKRWANYEPVVQRYTIRDRNWRGAKPLRIAHVSDFHGGSGIWSGSALQRIILQQDVDMVCVSGDHFDTKYSPAEGMAMLQKLAARLPVFFVSGNNDELIPNFGRLVAKMRGCGVSVLENESNALMMHGQPMTVFGVRDKLAYRSDDEWLWHVQQALQSAEKSAQRDDYRVVLSHRPEKRLLYDQLRQHVVLTGHAHGAQWHFPVVGGIFAPNQGIFPRYYRGVYRVGKDYPYHLVVSTGFDVHPVVPRLHNRPELVILEIKSEA